MRPGDRPGQARRRRLPVPPGGAPAAGAAATARRTGPPALLAPFEPRLLRPSPRGTDRAAARPGTGAGAHRQPLCFELAPASAPGARGARANEFAPAGTWSWGERDRELGPDPGYQEQDLGTQAGERGEGAGGLGQGSRTRFGDWGAGTAPGGAMQPGSSQLDRGPAGQRAPAVGGARVNFAL